MPLSPLLPAPEELFDVCVIGAGPAGLATALRCSERGLRVLVLEAGGPKPVAPAPDWLAEHHEIADTQAHVPLDVATRQAVGGTAWAWGGHCIALDAVDFTRREYVPESGWPISRADIDPWHAAAARFLDCGAGIFHAPPPAGWEGEEIDASPVGRYCRHANLAEIHQEAIRHSPLITLCHGRRLVRIELDGTGERIASLVTAGASGLSAAPPARFYVLAAGGLRTTQALLNLQLQWPRHFGGSQGPLGRFYSGHVSGEIASLVFSRPEEAAHFLPRIADAQPCTMRRLRISDRTQQSERVLNTAFILRSLPFGDPGHANGAMSLAAFLLQLPYLRRLQNKRVRGVPVSRLAFDPRQHLRLLADPRLPRDLAELASQITFGPRSMPLVLRNSAGRYALRFHAEQIPDAGNRVSLASSPDRVGVRPLVIRFAFSDDDAGSALKAHAVLDAMMRRTGLGHVDHWHREEARQAAILSASVDGYHQIGTTRMSDSADKGVVDRQCRVHGIANLFVASSSVFPTGGNANPTFPIVAFALRLADHIAGISGRAD